MRQRQQIKQRTHRVKEIDTMLGEIALDFDIVPFKLVVRIFALLLMQRRIVRFILAV